MKCVGVGIRPPDDPFFEESHEVCKVFQRKGVTVEDEEELYHEVIREFPCHAPECKAVFQTLLDFEMHYNSSHRYICTECKQARPNPRLLDIHIQETHDSFFQVLSKRQPMFQCFISECNLKFNNPIERREHCITVHKFPKNYRFDNVHRAKKKDSENKMEIDEPDDKQRKEKLKKVYLNKNQKVKMFAPSCKNPVSENVHQMIEPKSAGASKSTSLIFIPRQLQKSYTKALTSNQSNERNVLETETMMDLAESLPE